MTLAELKIGASATIETVGGEGHLRQHFLDMGMIPGIPVTMVKYAPMGDPVEVRIHGYELTLRRADAAQSARKQILNLFVMLFLFCPFLNFSENIGISQTRSAERMTENTGMAYRDCAHPTRKLSGVV